MLAAMLPVCREASLDAAIQSRASADHLSVGCRLRRGFAHHSRPGGSNQRGTLVVELSGDIDELDAAQEWLMGLG